MKKICISIIIILGVLLSPSIEINEITPQVTEEVENLECLEEIQTIAEKKDDASIEAAEDIKNNDDSQDIENQDIEEVHKNKTINYTVIVIIGVIIIAVGGFFIYKRSNSLE